ncbi:hypothetical protein EJ08DRAFT_242596 [Tothia fuscella]|uniref:Uncharacterized protein n=1 Tax=Tothia fuscella TaxID=1048955 RepID=A0A9P4NQW0_9PEZI|nr:hypothetical protein EJ08DRAFT_242596 [Tothia fuscella]
MAQGTIKKGATTNSAKSKRNTAGVGLTKRGSRIIAPKKAKVIAKKKIIKKHSSGLTGMTERALAQRAGHLEILAGGKNKKKDPEIVVKKDKKGTNGK